jgi:formylglycine-generating enzyme required for sulfatase activity
MGSNPSHFGAATGLDTRRFPVENVSWNDAVEFCRRLSVLPAEKQSGRTYRLPTEAEWEYSCRGGASSRTLYPFGNSITDKHANYNNRRKRTSSVGAYPPNGFGLHDMIGNVWEWCADWYDEAYYAKSPARDPEGPASGQLRVLRGGSWYNDASYCRAAYRDCHGPGYRNDGYGFRVVLLPA